MELKIKKAEVGLEKLASLYADALGLEVGELVTLARKKAIDKGIKEDEALFEVVREKGKMSATFIPLREWVVQTRSGEQGGIALATVGIIFDEGYKPTIGTIRAYPDDDAQTKAIQAVKVGMVAKPKTVWKMTGREGADIKDEFDRGIIGAKKLNLVDNTDEFIKDAVVEAFSADYKIAIGLTGDALENYTSGVKAKKDDGKSLFDAVIGTIAEFEEASLMIMSDLRLPKKRKDGKELKPRLDTIGMVERRGVLRFNEMALYYDSEEEALDAKSRLTVPIVGHSVNVFDLRTVDPDTQESIPMIDALGNIKLGVRGLVVDQQGEKVVEEYGEDYVNILDMCDKSKKVFETPVERGPNQKVEFYSPMIAPFAMINGVASTVDETTKNATLRLVLTDGERTILGNLYGSTALALVGADSPESFKDAVSRYHGSVMKDMRFFGARTHRFDEKTEQDVFYVTIGAIHAQIEPSDEEVETIFATAEKAE